MNPSMYGVQPIVFIKPLNVFFYIFSNKNTNKREYKRKSTARTTLNFSQVYHSTIHQHDHKVFFSEQLPPTREQSSAAASTASATVKHPPPPGPYTALVVKTPAKWRPHRLLRLH